MRNVFYKQDICQTINNLKTSFIEQTLNIMGLKTILKEPMLNEGFSLSKKPLQL